MYGLSETDPFQLFLLDEKDISKSKSLFYDVFFNTCTFFNDLKPESI